MKKYIILLSILFLTGCVYSGAYTVGKNFDSEQVRNIKKNETTKADLIRILGEPFSKDTLDANQEKWIYTYTEGEASAQAFTMKTTSTGTRKTLDIILKDDTVVNFTFLESPLNGTIGN